MAIGIKDVVMIAVALMVIALILPLGLGLLGIAGDTVVEVGVPFNATGINESAIDPRLLSQVIEPSVLTLLTVLIPVLAVIGIAVAFISFRD